MIQVAKVPVVVIQGRCLLRNALTDRLKAEEWIQLCDAAENVDEVETMIMEHNPSILIMNISMKCSAGITSLRQLKKRFKGLSIVAFSCDSDFEDTSVGHALKAGADGYVSSRDSLDTLVEAVRAISKKQHYVTWNADLKHHDRHSIMLGLSRREAEAFCLTGCGHVPQHVADIMGVSVKTVETFRDRIRLKLGLANGAELQYAATSVMRSAARGGIGIDDHRIVKALFSTTD
mgnify:CR=1 FL=1